MGIGLLVLAREGHLNPALALASELQGHGHQVIFFSMLDTVVLGQAAGIKVVECATQELPKGTVNHLMNSIAGGTPPWKMSAMMKEVGPLPIIKCPAVSIIFLAKPKYSGAFAFKAKARLIAFYFLDLPRTH
ncbi:MAG: hypothetical protein KME55_38955 [Nostoc indistinguendum CM1-VF10]|jgi:hypothetical protein|nr:hypothetical protein [Nostoc indistinguendum CM1-VF10]